MPSDLVMPQLGLTMTEGKVLQWYKSVGDTFQVGEPLFEVETDKVNMDVDATDGGTLTEILAPLNETLLVSTVIGRYIREGEAKTAQASRPPRTIASPRARRAALAANVDLAGLKGSGPNGRIVEKDVPRPVAKSAPPPPPSAPSEAPLSKIRRATAERMARSFQSAPHFYLTREIDATELLALKRMLSTAMAKRGVPHVSITDLLIKAMALAIVDHPCVNASWEDGRIAHRQEIGIGLAVAQEEGLVVPVLRNLGAADIPAIARKRAELVERVRGGRMKADDLGRASATLSNLGMFGVDQFQAILNPPESLIVATGRIRDRVVAWNGAPAVRPTLYCTISVDHRVLDGAQGARFLGTFAELIESPGLLLLRSSEAAQ